MNIYPKQILDFIQTNPYIVRKLRIGEHLKLYKRYWDSSANMYFKVHQIYDVDGVEYYSIHYPNALCSEVSFPVDTYYELIPDNNNIGSRRNIINSRRSYTGAEIKYWFFINNIDLESEKYIGFVSFLDLDSDSVISDNKYYYINAKLQDEVYSDCKLVLNRNKGGI